LPSHHAFASWTYLDQLTVFSLPDDDVAYEENTSSTSDCGRGIQINDVHNCMARLGSWLYSD